MPIIASAGVSTGRAFALPIRRICLMLLGMFVTVNVRSQAILAWPPRGRDSSS